MKPQPQAETVGDTGVTLEELHRLFDGELLDEQRVAELTQRLEDEEALAAEFAQMSALRGLVNHGLGEIAAAVPQARFEQVWDEIERTIAAPPAAPAESKPSFWSQLWGRLAPVRVPAVAAVTAAVLAVLIVRSGSNNPEGNPSVASAEQAASKPDPMPSTQKNPAVVPPPVVPIVEPSRATDAVAQSSFPEPKAGDAEIHGIEFGGQQGRIAHSGTVTVLYVEEDVEPQDSEREL